MKESGRCGKVEGMTIRMVHRECLRTKMVALAVTLPLD